MSPLEHIVNIYFRTGVKKLTDLNICYKKRYCSNIILKIEKITLIKNVVNINNSGKKNIQLEVWSKYRANANTKKNIERKVGKSRMPKHPTPPGFPSFLGGDPSAGSPTDTLLRLNPPRRRQARIPH